MKELLIMRVKNFIKENHTECIRYDWDGGHCYSYIDHSIIHVAEDIPELEELLSEWQYENDECPPCQIHVSKFGEVSSLCECHDHLDPVQESEEIQDILIELSELEKKYDNPYLITMD